VRKGSALLIVLGMLAFMVVSAVGFAFYMRESRRPSSHLRREATARYLLKSALANAIARLDGTFNRTEGHFEGIYDDVYPGVSRLNLPDTENGNLWRWRVFTPFGPVKPTDTVATLTLEGLAYLPPAIINEVRVASRTTRTAHWTNLAYDLGRYAFCAVDVSDCFDINKVYATGRRTSAADSRVNLSTLFPNNGAALDNLFDKAGNTPFVSVADFNIAAGSTPFTPFYSYIGSSGNRMYTSDDYLSVSNALFITDTWFPETNDYLTAELELKSRTTGSFVYDLALGTSGGSGDRKPAQPFDDYTVKNFLYVSDQLPVTSQGGLLLGNLGGVGLACLYDYLDADSVPISLALPTVETVPMVCGFSLVNAGGGLNPKFAQSEAVPAFTYTRNANGVAYTIERTVTKYSFQGAMNPQGATVSGTVLYPFKRLVATGRQAGKSFKIEPLVAMYYAESGMKARVKEAVFRPTKDLWTTPKAEKGLVWLKGTATGLTLPAKDLCGADAEQNAVIEFVVRLTDVPTVDMPVCFRVNERDVTPTKPGETPPPAPPLVNDKLTVDSLNEAAVADTRFRPFKADGTAVEIAASGYRNGLLTAADLQGNPNEDQNWTMPTGDYRLHYAVWLRVLDGSGKTVDLVPAVFADDEVHLEGCKFDLPPENDKLTAMCGADKPLLAFRADQMTEFKYEKAVIEALDGTKETVFENFKALYAPDPRYNFAPEDWKGVATEYNAKDDWKNNTAGYLGGTGRDKDIFMFTSDQEYLQSIGELQFLPFVQKLGHNRSFLSCDFADSRERYDGVVGSFANGARYWKTYTAISDDDADRNPFFDLLDNGRPAQVVSGMGSFRVNPFSRDARIMSVAVADTPYDYYVASTNDARNLKANMSVAEARQLAFGVNGTCEKWETDEISDIAGRLRDEFLNAARNGNTDFTEAMSDLTWDETDRTRLFGIAEPLADPLHGVDRKFLFSYWRECFQNRQQLFLVFIRAEPLTVGGSMGDSLANSQLGARGVALVWRDPAPPRGQVRSRPASNPTGDNAENLLQPHRTRILFYHQFE